MPPLAKQYVRKLMPTTVITAVRFQRLTAVPNTGLTVPANAKLNTTTTAATGATTAVLTAASPIGATVLPSARPAKQIPVIVLLLFRFLLTPAARHIFQPVLQSVPPGPAIPVTPSPEVFAQNPSATSVR